MTIYATDLVVFTEGKGVYSNCDELLTKGPDSAPGTSIFEMHNSGIPLDKIVIGKPSDNKQAKDGYIKPKDFSKCLVEAVEKGWKGGVMFWQVRCNINSQRRDR